MTAPVLDRPRWTPPRAANSFMGLMLRTPGLQRIVGKSTALLTFTGRKTGRRITTPLSYVRDGERIVVTGHRTRNWWRNLRENPEVVVRLAGKNRSGVATILEGQDAARALSRFFAAQPQVAKMARVELDEAGQPRSQDVDVVASYTTVVAIDLH